MLELIDDVIEHGRINNVLLRTICLPEKKSLPGSLCYTSGIHKNTRIIDAIPLSLYNQSLCDENNIYDELGITIKTNQLCAGMEEINIGRSRKFFQQNNKFLKSTEAYD